MDGERREKERRETHIDGTCPLRFEPDLPLGSFPLELHDPILELSNRSFQDGSFLLLKRLEVERKKGAKPSARVDGTKRGRRDATHELVRQVSFRLRELLEHLDLLLDVPLSDLPLDLNSFLGPHGSEVLVVGFGFLLEEGRRKSEKGNETIRDDQRTSSKMRADRK